MPGGVQYLSPGKLLRAMLSIRVTRGKEATIGLDGKIGDE